MNDKIEGIARKFLMLLSPALAEKYATSLTQFAKFGIVGVSNSIISYTLNVLTLLALRNIDVKWDYIVGNAVSFLLSVLWSFYWNNKYVFTQNKGESRIWWRALLKTYVCYGFTGIILNDVLSWLWVVWLGISKYIAPLINLIISVPLNYILNRLWAFRSCSDDAQHPS